MSTGYYICCKKCEVHSGFAFSREAWGTGNANVLLTMCFIMKHSVDCGSEYVEVVDENHPRVDCFFGWEEAPHEQLLTVFPHSSEWSDSLLEEETKRAKKKQNENDDDNI